MNKIQILIPDIEIQKQFAEFVHQVDKSEFTKEGVTMKKIGLGIAILLFAIVISLCSSGMEPLSIGIGIVGLIFSIIGFMERK